jgi:hypothetical protein
MKFCMYAQIKRAVLLEKHILNMYLHTHPKVYDKW